MVLDAMILSFTKLVAKAVKDNVSFEVALAFHSINRTWGPFTVSSCGLNIPQALSHITLSKSIEQDRISVTDHY